MTFTLKPKCPYCNALWTDDMIKLEVNKGGGCDTCGTPDTVLEIKCSNCQKLIYKKEGHN